MEEAEQKEQQEQEQEQQQEGGDTAAATEGEAATTTTTAEQGDDTAAAAAEGNEDEAEPEMTSEQIAVLYHTCAKSFRGNPTLNAEKLESIGWTEQVGQLVDDESTVRRAELRERYKENLAAAASKKKKGKETTTDGGATAAASGPAKKAPLKIDWLRDVRLLGTDNGIGMVFVDSTEDPVKPLSEGRSHKNDATAFSVYPLSETRGYGHLAAGKYEVPPGVYESGLVSSVSSAYVKMREFAEEHKLSGVDMRSVFAKCIEHNIPIFIPQILRHHDQISNQQGSSSSGGGEGAVSKSNVSSKRSECAKTDGPSKAAREQGVLAKALQSLLLDVLGKFKTDKDGVGPVFRHLNHGTYGGPCVLSFINDVDLLHPTDPLHLHVKNSVLPHFKGPQTYLPKNHKPASIDMGVQYEALEPVDISNTHVLYDPIEEGHDTSAAPDDEVEIVRASKKQGTAKASASSSSSKKRAEPEQSTEGKKRSKKSDKEQQQQPPPIDINATVTPLISAAVSSVRDEVKTLSESTDKRLDTQMSALQMLMEQIKSIQETNATMASAISSLAAAAKEPPAPAPEKKAPAKPAAKPAAPKLPPAPAKSAMKKTTNETTAAEPAPAPAPAAAKKPAAPAPASTPTPKPSPLSKAVAKPTPAPAKKPAPVAAAVNKPAPPPAAPSAAKPKASVATKPAPVAKPKPKPAANILDEL